MTMFPSKLVSHMKADTLRLARSSAIHGTALRGARINTL
jgi:hypothetical protein